jgi:hypothetical protein
MIEDAIKPVLYVVGLAVACVFIGAFLLGYYFGQIACAPSGG